MTSELKEEAPVAAPSAPILAALISGLWYITVNLYVYKNGVELSYGQIIGMHIGFIALGVILTHYLIRRSVGNAFNFTKLFMYGWMSSLVLGLITGLFYKVFFAQTGEQPNIPNYFARMLITYNLFGLVISAIVALFTSVISRNRE